MAKESAKTKTTQERRHLKCQLTQDEILEAGQKLAETIDQLRKLQVEKESVVKEFKAREAALEAEITKQQLLVRDKTELRLVECNNVLDYKKMECYVVRLDTKEELLRRAMTEDEKQTTLSFDDAEAA